MTKKEREPRKPSIEPTPYVEPPLVREPGGPLKRAAIAVFRDRRLPYSVAIRLDKLLHGLGSKHRIMHAGGLRFKIRRQTSDERFVHNIVNKKDYNTTPAYEVDDTDTVIDVGGQIGTFALQAAQAAAKGRVFTFEPLPESFSLLEANIRLNQMTNIVAEQAAVAGNTEPCKLYVTDFTGGNSMLPEYADDIKKFITVKSVTIPGIMEQHGIDRCNFLKMDCEGAEYDILVQPSYRVPSTH